MVQSTSDKNPGQSSLDMNPGQSSSDKNSAKFRDELNHLISDNDSQDSDDDGGQNSVDVSQYSDSRNFDVDNSETTLTANRLIDNNQYSVVPNFDVDDSETTMTANQLVDNDQYSDDPNFDVNNDSETALTANQPADNNHNTDDASQYSHGPDLDVKDLETALKSKRPADNHSLMPCGSNNKVQQNPLKSSDDFNKGSIYDFEDESSDDQDSDKENASSSKGALKRGTNQSKERPRKCRFCQKNFKYPCAQYRHEDLHCPINEKKKLPLCLYCDKAFANLNNHEIYCQERSRKKMARPKRPCRFCNIAVVNRCQHEKYDCQHRPNKEMRRPKKWRKTTKKMLQQFVETQKCLMRPGTYLTTEMSYSLIIVLSCARCCSFVD